MTGPKFQCGFVLFKLCGIFPCENRIYSTIMYDFICVTSCFSFEGFLINKSNQKLSFSCEILPRCGRLFFVCVCV